jgi:arylsulfatase A-like enzyme
VNILFITLDQFRGDCLSIAGHQVVKTPNLDRLAREGVRFARHYGQASPCGPGRASLYTGIYQFNHRVVGNGAPLDDRFDNIARCATRAGYRPTLFGYTDQALDPRAAEGPDDPRLTSYEQVLPGFAEGLHLPMGELGPWTDWLKSLGHDPGEGEGALLSEPERPAEASLSAFLTDRLVAWIGAQREPWFVHLSQLRPHPPYAAAGRFAQMYAPADMPTPVIPARERCRLHERLLAAPDLAAPSDPAAMAALMAQYFGMVSEADHQLGRLWAALEAAGQWDDTFILVTADHGEQLGDHGLLQKFGFFEESFHIPLVVRDPRHPLAHGRVVEGFTESVDVLPTLAETMSQAAPRQCDGASLMAWLEGGEPPWRREAAHWEFDWRRLGAPPSPAWDRRPDSRNLQVRRAADCAFIQFADGEDLAFDLAADLTWRTPLTDPARLLEAASATLAWRARHAPRPLSRSESLAPHPPAGYDGGAGGAP